MAANPSPRRSIDPRIRVFDRIAWIYGWLFHAQRLGFRRSFRALDHRLALPRRARILDIGCGTGAQVSVLAEKGYEVSAVDASARMIAAAGKLLHRVGLSETAGRLAVGDPLRGLGFPDRHFDLVLAAHVLHGMQKAQRRRFYTEARRLSRGPVMFYDFSPRRFRRPGFVVRMLEALEGSDYKSFRRSGAGEMRECFGQVEILAGASGSAWYLCRS